MSLFQCSKCGVTENTALTFGYLARLIQPETLKEKGLLKDGKYCSTCYEGTWHGRFPQEFNPIGSMETGPDGNLRKVTSAAAGKGER